MIEPDQRVSRSASWITRAWIIVGVLVWLGAVVLLFGPDDWRTSGSRGIGGSRRQTFAAPTASDIRLQNVSDMIALNRTVAGFGAESYDARPLFVEILEAMRRAHIAVRADAAPSGTAGESYGVSGDAALKMTDAPAVMAGAEADKAEELLRAMTAKGVGSKIDELTSRGGMALLPISDDGRASMYEMVEVNGAAVRGIARMMSYRFAERYRAGKSDDAGVALRRSLSVSNVLMQQPVAMQRLLANATLAQALARVRTELVAKSPSEEFAMAALRMVESATVLPLSDVLLGERLMALDLIAREDPLFQATRERAARAKTNIDEYYRAAAQLAENLMDSKRGTGENPMWMKIDDLMKVSKTVQSVAVSLAGLMRSELQVRVMHEGTVVMLAIEAHTARHSQPPVTLAAIDQDILKAVPNDPISGLPFGYRLIDKNADEHGRRYLLYSYGCDLADNGGTQNTTVRVYALNPSPQGGPTSSEGLDFVLNDPDSAK